MATKINTTINKYFDKFKEIAHIKYNNVENINIINNGNKGNAQEYNFIFEIGEEKYVLFIWYSNEGISHNVAQKNNKAKQEVLNSILKEVDACFNDKIMTNSHTFSSVSDKIFQELKNEFSTEPYRVEETSQNHIIKIILDNTYNITVSYFKDTRKLLLQGKTTLIWDAVFFFLSEKLNFKSTDIVKIYLSTNEELNRTEFEMDNNLSFNNLKTILNYQSNSKNILLTSKIELLKTSEQFLSLNINATEYSFMLIPSFRVIEGLLRRIIDNNDLIDNSQEKSNKFYQFHTKDNQLDEQYHIKLNNDKIIIAIINKIYNLYNNKRLIYSHSDGVNPAIIKNKENAIAIFNDICTLLIQVLQNADKLFKPIKV